MRFHRPAAVLPGRAAEASCADGPVLAQYHRSNLPREVVEAMPPKRQTLFRGVWGHGGDPFENVYYDPETNFAW